MIISTHAGQLPLADETVQCVVTSPPYWGLRKYAGEQEIVWGGDVACAHDFLDQSETISEAVGNWQQAENGLGLSMGIPQTRFRGDVKAANARRSTVIPRATCARCGAWRGGYGLEPTIEMYVAHTVEILREVRRVLRKDGVLFWNIRDSYCHGATSTWHASKTEGVGGWTSHANEVQRNGCPDGLKPKDLCLIPARVALAAQADGWWVRSMIIWAKPNPMPESVTDRPTDAYEQIIMLTKSARYFWDADAVREPSVTGDTRKPYCPGQVDARGNGHDRGGGTQTERDGASRNLRNVWTFPTQPYSGAHFATFPEELPRRCILAATSDKGACRFCGAPWEKIVKASGGTIGEGWHDHSEDEMRGQRTNQTLSDGSCRRDEIGWRPTCKCRNQHGRTIPQLVLDPFGGSGTTGRVAIELRRRPILCDVAYGRSSEGDREKGREYHRLADKRTRNVQVNLL